VKNASHADIAFPKDLDVIKLTSDVSELLCVSESLDHLVSYARLVLSTCPAARAAIATGPLDTVLVESDRVLAYLGVGPALLLAQESATTALVSTIALCDETIKDLTRYPNIKMNTLLKLIPATAFAATGELAVSTQAAHAVAQTARLLDAGRFSEEAEKGEIKDDRILMVMRMMENKHSTRGEADEAQMRANLQQAIDGLEQTNDVGKISDLMINVARSCSALFSLGRSGGRANDPRVKERVEHLTNWLNQITAQFNETRNSAELASPILVGLETEYANLLKVNDKLSRLATAEKNLASQSAQLTVQLEIITKETEVAESQVAEAYAELVRNTITANSRP
jgi:hypothetical protein